MGQPFAFYRVKYFAGGSTSYKYRAIITLENKGDPSWSVIAYFHRNPGTLPPHDQKSTHPTTPPTTPPQGQKKAVVHQTVIECHYPWEDFPVVLDLLRNEKPVMVDYLANENVGFITTAYETVGEGEPT